MSKIVSMISKYHNHKLQTNPSHRKVESNNNHETPGRQTKKKKTQLSLPHQDYYKTSIGHKVTEEGGAENEKSKIFSKSELFWYQSVPLVLTKKMPIHTMFLFTNKKVIGV